MTATLVSLIAVTLGFIGLLAWVYWPSRKKRLETYGRIPLDEQPGRRPNPDCDRTST